MKKLRTFCTFKLWNTEIHIDQVGQEIEVEIKTNERCYNLRKNVF